MANFNKVILMGNLTRDVELKSIGSGQTVGKIGLAVNRNFTTASGEKRTETTFVDCEAWGKQAEIMAKYLTKGKPVMIEGRLKYEQWEDKEGKKRSTLRVVVENFQFVGAPGGGGGGGGGGENGGGSQGNWSRGQSNESREPTHEPEHAGGSPDDIPF